MSAASTHRQLVTVKKR